MALNHLYIMIDKATDIPPLQGEDFSRTNLQYYSIGLVVQQVCKNVLPTGISILYSS